MKRPPADFTGQPLEVPPPLASAFVAFGNGVADGRQQKAVLQAILELGGVGNSNAALMEDSARAYSDGARWLANTIIALTGSTLVLRSRAGDE